MRGIWWAVVLGVVLSPAAARADAVAPGSKYRVTRVVVDNPEGYPDDARYLVPVGVADLDGPAHPTRLIAGEPVRTGKAARWLYLSVLIAVPREWADRRVVTWEALTADPPGARRSAPVWVHQLGSASILWPVDDEVRHFRIGLSNGQLTLTPGPVEQHSDGFRSWLPARLTMFAVAGLGFWSISARSFSIAFRSRGDGADN